jgi:hypothetical protein
MYNLRFKQSKIYKQNSSLTCNKITYMRSYINRKIDLIIKQNPYMFAIKIIQGLSWHDTSINIYFCNQYISLFTLPEHLISTPDKIVWVSDYLAFQSFDFECLPDECCSTFDIEFTWWMLFYFGHWVYLMNVVLLLTLNLLDECCSTFDFEFTWWMLFYFGHWVYLMNVVLLLTLSLPDECCSTFDIKFTWWMLFYFWLWVYLMNVVLLWTLSLPDECCSTLDFECTWWMLLYFWHWV